VYNYNKYYNLILKSRNTGNETLAATLCEILKSTKSLSLSTLAQNGSLNLIQSNKILLSSVLLYFIFRRIPFVSSYRDFESNETINFVL